MTWADDTIPVTFGGARYFWLKNPDGSGALAYPEHIDDTGDVKFEHMLSESYAYVFPDGKIIRQGIVIGSVNDLQQQKD